MSDTWVTLDGRDPTTFFRTCWICDCGTYTGPVPAVLDHDVSWVPTDAHQVDWLIALPKPGGDAEFVADGSYTTQTYYQTYTRTAAAEFVDPSAIDSGAHLFAVWFDPAFPDDPASLVTPSASPLDLVPAALVSGGRLIRPRIGVFTMPITTPNVRVVGDSIGVFTMPITMPAVGAVTAGAAVSLGVFDMPITMPPLFQEISALDDPPADWSDLGPADPVYSEDGSA